MNEKPVYFGSAEEWRAWLEKQHGQANEVWLGFHHKAAKKTGLTIRAAVDQALCFGWIDGILKKTTADGFKVRFTPRRSGSLWSEVNTRRARQLIKLGLITPAGLAAFKKRDVNMTKRYSYEARSRGLSAELVKAFKRNKPAWSFFHAQAPSYQRTISFWVMDAKQGETRLRRLKRLIDVSAQQQRVNLLAPFGKRR